MSTSRSKQTDESRVIIDGQHQKTTTTATRIILKVVYRIRPKLDRQVRRRPET